MALANINKFNWEKILSKVESADVKRSINLLRAKANEITSNSSKYLKEPEAIDFNAYKNKLKFTGSAVQALEAAYKSKELPTYHATLPQLEAKRNAMMVAVTQNIVELLKTDLQNSTAALQEFESIRINKSTSANDLSNRFPAFAKEVEEEINSHKWNK
mmetsp:Transcript_4589/g.9301  ORF Transcript_4589/g.9301 Transcript_4589/m.9301 type:complete len:159 (-) Transcript_4589:155-631(-)|eukprot:CAMPEP_0170384058 /NCGR_PEP_ID=MMETSP0117_2-20130122/15800_1 /TAXON_ID=400756 /ORGANISM="Durinskia baltica, Strain CSIRO CS-38" /LENGTH=158 /DNA_ID=CAMNT_0010639791 /DNA_START=238 /DNA_END=714 /DNA_ORIENTATION=-